jgi:hypothetical protein
MRDALAARLLGQLPDDAVVQAAADVQARALDPAAAVERLIAAAGWVQAETERTVHTG